MLIVSTYLLEFQSSWANLVFVECLPSSFSMKIILEVIGDKSVELIFVSLFEFNLLMGWLSRSDSLDMRFKLA